MKYNKNSLWGAFAAFVVVLLAVSCQKMDSGIGGSLVDGNKVEIKHAQFNSKAWSIFDISLDTLNARNTFAYCYSQSNISAYSTQVQFNYLGHYLDPQTGTLDAGFVTRASVTSKPFFGDEVIDSVELIISYSPVEGLLSGDYALAGYETNSKIYKGLMGQDYFVYGYNSSSTGLNVQMYELNEAIPDPSSKVDPDENVYKANIIPLNKDWQFKPNPIIDRNVTVSFDTLKTTVPIDSTRKDDGSYEYEYGDSIYPRLYVLQKQAAELTYWQGIFDHFKGQVMTVDALSEYIKGFYFKTATVGANTPLLMLNLNQKNEDNNSAAVIRVHYHTALTKGSTFDISFSQNYTANNVRMDLAPKVRSQLSNPNTKDGESTIYILPFGVSESVVELVSADDLQRMREQKWVINDAYIEFTNTTNTSNWGGAVQLWLYRYKYRNQFMYYSPSKGYPYEYVQFYIPDYATYSYNSTGMSYDFSLNPFYKFNGIVNQNEYIGTSDGKTGFNSPGTYKLRVTAMLTALLNPESEQDTRLGLRLPFGATQNVPFRSVFNIPSGLKLQVFYTVKDTDGGDNNPNTTP